VKARLEEMHHILTLVRAEAAKVIIGQQRVIDEALVAIMTARHALVEGVPGVAKTLIVRTLAQLLGCPFHRIQFTPDLTPNDIIGASHLNEQTGEFVLSHGPVFTTFLLADEINRAPAKTQSALLQAMQERQVSVDRDTYTLSPNFTVFATQNPIEFEGTYPLPEAQKDRFLIKIIIDYPNEDEEVSLAERTLTPDAPENLIDSGVVQPVLTPERLAHLRESLDIVRVPPDVVRYAVALARVTRNHSAIKVGAGPRATQALLLSSRAMAAIRGHESVSAGDVRRMALACLEHRIILRQEFVEKGLTCAEAVDHVLRSVPAPACA